MLTSSLRLMMLSSATRNVRGQLWASFRSNANEAPFPSFGLDGDGVMGAWIGSGISTREPGGQILCDGIGDCGGLLGRTCAKCRVLGSVACETDDEDEVVDCAWDECRRELALSEMLAGEADPNGVRDNGTRSSKV